MTATPACAGAVAKALGAAASEVTQTSCIAVLDETMGTIEPYLSTALIPTPGGAPATIDSPAEGAEASDGA